jgi:hypothetical protein
MRSFIVCVLHQILLVLVSSKEGWGRWDMEQMISMNLSGRATRRWEDTIEIELNGLGCRFYSSGSG